MEEVKPKSLKRKTVDPPATDIVASSEIETLEISDRLKRGLEKLNFTSLTPIQSSMLTNYIPFANFMLKAETGSGKTLAYLLPLLNELIKTPTDDKFKRDSGTLVLIIGPTRELCLQITDIAKKLLTRVPWFVVGSVMGGENIKKEKAKIRKGLTVLVATPGRLIYHIRNTECFKFSNLRAIIFDECDRTLDMGFERELTELKSALLERLKTSFEELQLLFVSATITKQLEKFTFKLTSETPIFVGEFNEEETHTVPSTLQQSYLVTGEWNRITLLLCYLKNCTDKTIVFFQTIDEVEYFYLLLAFVFEEEFQVHKLHGNIEQKLRSETYFHYRTSTAKSILVSTEVASRGLDFANIRNVVVFDVPSSIVNYVNMVGRTARIANEGKSVLFLMGNEMKYLEILKKRKLELKELDMEDVYKGAKSHPKDKIVEMYKDLTYKFVSNSYDNAAYARRAFNSFVRAYGFNNKRILEVKDLNLKALSNSYGLESVYSRKSQETSNEEYKEGHHVKKMEKDFQAKRNQDRGVTKKARSTLLDTKALANMEFM